VRYVIVPDGPARELAPNEDFVGRLARDLGLWDREHLIRDPRPQVWLNYADAMTVAAQPRVRQMLRFCNPDRILGPGVPEYVHGAKVVIVDAAPRARPAPPPAAPEPVAEPAIDPHRWGLIGRMRA
jgi:hypothetical protein